MAQHSPSDPSVTPRGHSRMKVRRGMKNATARSPRWLVIRPLIALACYGFAAVWVTWPLALTATTSFPIGLLGADTVPLLNLWTMWWNSDRLRHGLSGYWNAPLFYPAQNTFALSEPQPVTLIVAPVIWLTGSRVLAYNCYLWLSLIFNGLFAERLLRVAGVSRCVALLGAWRC